MVGVDGERRVAMSEPFRNNLDRYPSLDEQRAMGVTQVMEPDSGTSARFTILSDVCEIEWGWIGSTVALVSTQLDGLTPTTVPIPLP